MLPYIKIKDIKEKILRKYRFDFWLDQCHSPEARLSIGDVTVRNHPAQESWLSIGIEDKGIYSPLWDVYTPTPIAREVVTNRLKYACLQLGGRYAGKNK